VDANMMGWGIGLLATMLGMTFGPKVLGLLHALLDGTRRHAFGGARRVLAGAAGELAGALVMGPVIMVAQSLFVAGLPFGRKVRWAGQVRDDHGVPFRAALRGLWPQTLLGALGIGFFAWQAPGILPWALPMLAAWLLAAPFAWLSAHPGVSRACRARALWATPEERAGLRAPAAELEPRGAGPVPVAEVPAAPSE
jgi:membrane glycosyltransferase